MKFLGKKGQGAMEYLMTYGWAILVVMIVGVVLWQLGIFNLGGQTKTMTGFGAVKPIDWDVDSSGSGTLIIVNGEGTPIKSVTVGGDCSGTYGSDIPNGGSAKITVTCTGGTAGSGYTLDIGIGYTKTIGGTTITHNSTGQIIGVYS